MRLLGAARGTVAVLAGAGLVWGAQQVTDTADATRPGDVRQVAADTTSSALRDVSLTCAGADAEGEVLAASAPAAWVNGKTSSDGSVALDSGSSKKTLQLRRGGTGAGALPASTTGTVTGKGGLATGLVAAQSRVDDRTSARGLNLSGCGEPVRDGWFFGGGPEAGRVAKLTLVNSGATPTTVDATVVGSQGADSGVTVKGTVLGPGERKVLSLGDFGPTLRAAAVHVTATGAGVSASLTDAWMNGETPVGEDTTSAPVTPDEKLDVPGVSASNAAPQVRLAVPGKDEAIVRVRAVDPSGAVALDKVETVDAGTSHGMTLTGLPAGDYDVQVTADVPVAAAVLSRTADSGTTDLAWSPAVPAAGAPVGSPAPRGIPDGRASLMLTAPSRTTAEVVTVTSTGSHTKTVAVPADRPVVTKVDGASAVWVKPAHGGKLRAVLTVRGTKDGAGLLATVPLQQTALSKATNRLLPARD